MHSRFPLFYTIKETIQGIFSPRNILLQLVACVLTYVIVASSFDWTYYLFIQSQPGVRFLIPAIGIGGLVPILGIPLLYLVAKISKNKKLLVITWALAQAAMLGSAISSTYKAFTGRMQPPRGDMAMYVDTSHQWNFGFLEHGIFWEWPSSHTTIAFAMACALIALFPKKKVVLLTALLYAFYIGIGVSTRIHWFSEFAAGAIIGAVIGMVVGKQFHGLLKEEGR